MTKARDLAGFASSSVTTTASDGLVLKGDGSSTDVVIKNGANATVATVADGTTNLAVVGAVTGALAQGAIQVGNSSGVAAPLTIGSNAQLLQSNGTTAAWATVSSNTYTAQSTAATPTSLVRSDINGARLWLPAVKSKQPMQARSQTPFKRKRGWSNNKNGTVSNPTTLTNCRKCVKCLYKAIGH